MKIKNVMFSGVMAAILMSVAGAANAADPISVASTGYVDAKVGVVDTKVGTIPQGGFTVGSATYSDVATAIKALDTKTEGVVGSEDMQNIQDSIATLTGDENKEGSVKQQINAVKTAQAEVDAAQNLKITANQGAIEKLNANAETDGSVAHSIANAVIQQSQVQGLETALGDKADKTTIGDVAEGKTVVQMIADAKLEATYNDTQVKADIAQNKADIAKNAGDIATKASASDLTDLANAVNDAEKGLAKTNEIATANKAAIEAENTGLAAAHTAIATLNGGADQTGSVAYAVKGLADGAVATNTGAIAKLNGADTEEGSVAHTVKGYAVPKPGANCAHTKCVLSVDQDGAPYWMELALSL